MSGPNHTESKVQKKKCEFDPWVRKLPGRRAWQPSPAFLPGESSCSEGPGGLQSVGSQRLGHNGAIKHILWSDWGYFRPTARCV